MNTAAVTAKSKNSQSTPAFSNNEYPSISKSVDQTHDLLNPQRDCKELSEVGPPRQARRLGYTNLINQLH